jgi:hypothetical protein
MYSLPLKYVFLLWPLHSNERHIIRRFGTTVHFLFWGNKRGLWDHFAICVSVYPHKFFVFYTGRVESKERRLFYLTVRSIAQTIFRLTLGWSVSNGLKIMYWLTFPAFAWRDWLRYTKITLSHGSRSPVWDMNTIPPDKEAVILSPLPWRLVP